MALVRANLNYKCDWRLGLNHNPRGIGRVGYLLYWSGCGGLNLAKDIWVPNPFTSPGQSVVSGDTVKCIGLLESFKFEGEEDDPIHMVAHVSQGAMANLQSKLSRPVTSTKVQVAWYIIAFDGDRNRWFEQAYIDKGANANCNLDTSDGELQISIANESNPVGEKTDPQLYRFEFQIIPAAGAQSTLQFASGVTQRFVKSWGASS